MVAWPKTRLFSRDRFFIQCKEANNSKLCIGALRLLLIGMIHNISNNKSLEFFQISKWPLMYFQEASFLQYS